MATEKQVSYLLALLRSAGYPTDWMGSRHKELPVRITMRERSGRVVDWLRSLDTHRASQLIDALKAEIEGGK